jgi:hypothetical protein
MFSVFEFRREASMSLISLKNVSYSLGVRPLFSELSFAVEPGSEQRSLVSTVLGSQPYYNSSLAKLMLIQES